MDGSSFETQLATLATVFGRNIKENQISILYERLKFIPNEAWIDICEQAIDEWDTWPRNFIKVIKGMWFGWQKDHRATGEIEFQDCAYCVNTGCLDYDYWYKERERWMEASCFCGHCNNYLRHTHTLINRDRSGKQYRAPRYTVEEIADEGWKWHEAPPLCTKQEAIAAMKAMLKKLEEKADAFGLPKPEQAYFDIGRPSRQESIEAQEEIPF